MVKIPVLFADGSPPSGLLDMASYSTETWPRWFARPSPDHQKFMLYGRGEYWYLVTLADADTATDVPGDDGLRAEHSSAYRQTRAQVREWFRRNNLELPDARPRNMLEKEQVLWGQLEAPCIELLKHLAANTKSEVEVAAIPLPLKRAGVLDLCGRLGLIDRSEDEDLKSPLGKRGGEKSTRVKLGLNGQRLLAGLWVGTSDERHFSDGSRHEAGSQIPPQGSMESRIRERLHREVIWRAVLGVATCLKALPEDFVTLADAKRCGFPASTLHGIATAWPPTSIKGMGSRAKTYSKQKLIEHVVDRWVPHQRASRRST